jgi:cob(I)alamin adenosyltransferase
MGLYTRSGDDGGTGLFGGERVGKEHPRVEAYGTIDELNAALGLALAAATPGRPLHARLLAILASVQARLFDLGADLATPADSPHRDKVGTLTDAAVHEVESWIDEIDGGNEPLRRFVLPGGCELAARLHTARTICRRAERRIVVLARISDVSPSVVPYVNRLGDLLFAMARRANSDAGVPDVTWTGSSRKDPT